MEAERAIERPGGDVDLQSLGSKGSRERLVWVEQSSIVGLNRPESTFEVELDGLAVDALCEVGQHRGTRCGTGQRREGDYSGNKQASFHVNLLPDNTPRIHGLLHRNLVLAGLDGLVHEPMISADRDNRLDESRRSCAVHDYGLAVNH